MSKIGNHRVEIQERPAMTQYVTDTIPDHVGREAVRLLNAEGASWLAWPGHTPPPACVITVAKLLMNPPAPMTDPDEEAAKRVVSAWYGIDDYAFYVSEEQLTRATEQMRKEREAWEAGR